MRTATDSILQPLSTQKEHGAQDTGSQSYSLNMRSIRSSSPNDYSYNRGINGLIRLRETKITLYGELEMRNRLFFRENQETDCQVNEALRRICCEETDRARQARIVFFYASREESYACESTVDSHSGFTEQGEFLGRCEGNFTILKHRAALEQRPFPVNPLLFRVSGPYLAAILVVPHDILHIVGTSGNFFERLPAREGRTSTLFNKSKNLASSSRDLRPDTPGTPKRRESEMRRQPLNTSIPLPHFQSGGGLLNHTGGTWLTVV